MNLLSYPGGATKGFQIAQSGIEVYDKGFIPDVIFATSVSSYLAIPIHLKMYELVKNVSSNLTHDQMFDVTPMNSDGKITTKAYWRMFKGLIKLPENYSLGLQDTRKFINDYITCCDYEAFKQTGCKLYLFTGSPTTGKPEWYCTDDINFKQYIEIAEATAHIPVMTQAVNINNEYFIDGGLWAHNPVALLSYNKIIDSDPTKVVSIYPREKEFKVVESMTWKNNVLSNIQRTMEIANVSVSTLGQHLAHNYFKLKNIPHLELFCPQIFDSTYDVDRSDFEEAKETYKEIQKQIKNNIDFFN